MNATSLPNHYHWQHILITGPDATPFLQGQLTCDVSQLTSNDSALAAHCSHKGRVVSLFWLLKIDDGYALKLPHSMLNIAMSNLNKYAIFSKVDIKPVDELPNAYEAGHDGGDNTKLQALQAGLPMVYPETSEQFLPQMLNLDKLGGVSFTKGCYTGQEVIARTQNLGKLKRHMVACTAEGSSPPQPGTELINLQDNKAKSIGQVVDACMNSENEILMLAVIQDKFVEQENVHLKDMSGPRVKCIKEVISRKSKVESGEL